MSLELSAGLVALGVLFLLADIFVPGAVLGIRRPAGAGRGGRRFSHGATAGLSLLLGAVGGGVLLGWLGIRVFPRSPAGRRLILQQNGRDWQGYDGGNQALAGAHGTSHSPCVRLGIAIIGDQRVDVVTRGEMIEAGKPVEVIEVEGNRIVVRETPPQPVATS